MSLLYMYNINDFNRSSSLSLPDSRLCFKHIQILLISFRLKCLPLILVSVAFLKAPVINFIMYTTPLRARFSKVKSTWSVW